MDEDNSAITAPARLARYREKERQRLTQLEAEQETLAVRERAEAKQLHATRSKLDRLTTKIETLAAKRATPEAAFQHVLECMRVAPQKPIAAFGGWSAEELQAVAAVYSGGLAQKIANVVAAQRGEAAPEIGALPPVKQGRMLTLEEIMIVDKKRRGEL